MVLCDKASVRQQVSLPELMLTQISVAIWASLGHNELNLSSKQKRSHLSYIVNKSQGIGKPIGLSPGSWQTSLGLGSMSRYSAQILICFIAYIFLIFFHSSVGLVGNFAGLPVCTVPSAIVHCNQNEAGHQTIKAPSMPCWGAVGPSKQSLAFKSQSGENDR